MLTLSAAEAGQTLERIVHNVLGAEAAELVLKRGGVWLENHRISDPSIVAPLGAQLKLHRPPNGCYPEISLDEDDILYEDEWLLAIHKQAGWYTNATPWDTQGNVLTALTRMLQRRSGELPRLHLVHRLDCGTSGVLLVSLHSLVNAPLQAAFSNGTVSKIYLCACIGKPDATYFEVRTGHGRTSGGRWRLYPFDQVGTIRPNGSRIRFAHTEFECFQEYLSQTEHATLLRAIPHTGRTHQIRLHMSEAGYALIGDIRYGGVATFAGQTRTWPLLHAAHIDLTHPVTSKKLEIHARLPEWVQTLFPSVT